MRLNDDAAILEFFSLALTNKPLTVFGEGIQTRSFIYNDEEVEGIYRFLLSNENEPNYIGNPEKITIKQTTNEIIQITNSKSRIIHKDIPIDDPKVRKPDISKTIKALG